MFFSQCGMIIVCIACLLIHMAIVYVELLISKEEPFSAHWHVIGVGLKHVKLVYLISLVNLPVEAKHLIVFWLGHEIQLLEAGQVMETPVIVVEGGDNVEDHLLDVACPKVSG